MKVKVKMMHMTMFRRGLSGVAALKSRKLLRLDGLDAAKFLQGLTTNDIQKLHPDQNHHNTGQFSALLNAQVFIIKY